MPPNLVSVMPENTELPIFVKASAARRSRVSCTDIAKQCTKCEQNSTDIPTAMTRLTNDTAFNDIDHRYIRPPMFITIIVIVITTTIDEWISKPISKNVTTNMANMEMPMLCNVSGHIVKYCS